MTTLLTPFSTALRAFSTFGFIPPEMIPLSSYILNISRVMRGITLLSSSGLLRTPFFSKENIRVTSNLSAKAFATVEAIVSALVLRIFPIPSCVRGATTGVIPLLIREAKRSPSALSTSPTKPKSTTFFSPVSSSFTSTGGRL